MLHKSPLIRSRLANPFMGKGPVAAGVLTTLAFQASATSSNSATITCPTVQAGDLIVMLDTAWSGGGTPSAVTPAGFTNVVSTTDAFTRQSCHYKIAAGTESGSTITGMAAGNGSAKIIQTFRGNAAVSAIVASTPGGQMTDGNPTLQTVSASGQATPLIVFGAYSSAGVVNPRTFSTTKTGETNATGIEIDLWLAYKNYNSSPANTNIDMDDEGFSNCIQSFYLRAS